MSSPIPVTILSGFLGAGKTTLLRYLLKAEHGLKIAVIENEFSDAGIDTQLLGDEPVQVMTLANGCVCCTIHTDLTKALHLLLERLDSGEIAFDRLVIECTGLADPAPVAQTFFIDEELRERYLLDNLHTARSEAKNAFGSDELILEHALIDPRHVEIQLFGDSHGHLIYLGERDCSIQRRHQKVIEEAPCPVMTPELRQAMGEAALKAGRAVNYVGAGTVEFLLDRRNLPLLAAGRAH